jgi:phage gpG-like protein
LYSCQSLVDWRWTFPPFKLPGLLNTRLGLFSGVDKMGDVDVRITDTGVEAKLREVTPQIRVEAKKAIRLATILLATFIKTVTYPASGLHVRSGTLRRSIVPGKVDQTSKGIVGRVLIGQGIPYARIQEYGGTIKPVRAQYLAIPLEAVKTPSGVAKFGPRQAEQFGWQTFIAKHIIFGKRPGESSAASALSKAFPDIAASARSASITPLFALKKSVTLPARPYLRPAVKAKAPEIRDMIEQAIRRALEE